MRGEEVEKVREIRRNKGEKVEEVMGNDWRVGGMRGEEILVNEGS